jgi:hypothetical protein
MTCSECGARAPAEAAWCGQCMRRFDAPPEPEPQEFHRQVPIPTPVPARVYSRWRKSATSFGPVGRLLWTLGVLLIAGLCVFSSDPIAIAGWCLIGAPLILRSVWAKSRVV